MRAELEQIKKVEDYLLGNLNKTEQSKIEELIKNDVEFAQEIEWQKIVMERINKIAIKNEIAAAHKKYMNRFRFSLKNKVFRNYLLSTTIILSIIVSGIFIINKKLKTNSQNNDSSVSYYQSKINPMKGAVLNFPEGTYVIIPSEAFIDEKGTSVNSPVTIKYRQFSRSDQSPIKGSLDNHIEIKAYHNNHPLKLKGGSLIEVVLKHENCEQTKENNQKAKAFPLELSGQIVNGKLLPKLMQGLHIENPEGDSLAIRKRDLLIEALNQLDSINSFYTKETTGYYEETEFDELIRKRLIVICNSENQEAINKLLAINPDKESILANSSLIEKEYNNYENLFINELKLNFRFYKTMIIMKLGHYPIK